MAETEYLTQDAFDRLSAELEERRTVKRVDITKKIEEARAHGDLKENAEYHAAKEAQGQNEAKIRELEARLRNATIGAAPVAPGTAAAGTFVTTRDTDGNEREVYLGSREERVDGAIVTPGSPLGQALVGRKVGDVVTYKAPAGDRTLEILAVRPR